MSRFLRLVNRGRSILHAKKIEAEFLSNTKCEINPNNQRYIKATTLKTLRSKHSRKLPDTIFDREFLGHDTKKANTNKKNY